MENKKKILLLGSAGMAGHVVLKYLSESQRYQITDVARNRQMTSHTVNLDITQKQEVENMVTQLKPDYIVNCIGTLIRESNNDKANAIYVNAYFPNQLMNLARAINARLIHISTDCVFSGDRGGYTEADFKDGKDVYAQTKALGEVINDTDLTIRTSIIGPEIKGGEGLFHWFMQQKGDINGYNTAFWSGVTTVELAKTIQFVLQENTSGLVHLTAKQKVSKYDLLKLFQKIWRKNDVSINPLAWKNVDKSLVNTRKDFDYTVPDYETMLKELLDHMEKYKPVYAHYTF